MKSVTPKQMQQLDAETIRDFKIPGELLMDRAGFGVADAVRRMADASRLVAPSVLLVAGRGNNGGDAFVAARYLKEWQFGVEVWIVGEAASVRGDAAHHLSLMRSAGVIPQELPTKEDWDAIDIIPGQGPDILVDGVLGTGTVGPARGPAAGAIRYINLMRRQSAVVAIDIPSGLNGDTGRADGDCVTADLTVTMGLPKCGLTAEASLPFTGTVEVLDIGIPAELLEPIKSDVELLTAVDVAGFYPQRQRTDHKGSWGHVLIIAGARGYTGAAIMTCRAACRSGVGLVTALVPDCIADTVAGAVPEAMVHAAPSENGALAPDALEQPDLPLDRFDAVVAGPGLTPGPATLAIVKHLLLQGSKPLVLDADALNAIAADPAVLCSANGPVILTPHPGEMARLTGQTIADIQSNRLEAARKLSESTRATVVLKGAGTVVAAPGHIPWVSRNGNPGMAKGGMGDVLAGLMGGLAAQPLDTLNAVLSAVYIHGAAGDSMALQLSQAGFTADDLIEELSAVPRTFLPR